MTYFSTRKVCSLPNSITLLPLPISYVIILPLTIFFTIFLAVKTKQTRDNNTPIICNAAATQPSYALFSSMLSFCSLLCFMIVILLHVRILNAPPSSISAETFTTYDPNLTPPPQSIGYHNALDISHRMISKSTSLHALSWLSLLFGLTHATSLILMAQSNYTLWPGFHNIAATTYIISGIFYQIFYTALSYRFLYPFTPNYQLYQSDQLYLEPNDQLNAASHTSPQTINILRILFAAISTITVVCMLIPGYLEFKRLQLRMRLKFAGIKFTSRDASSDAVTTSTGSTTPTVSNHVIFAKSHVRGRAIGVKSISQHPVAQSALLEGVRTTVDQNRSETGITGEMTTDQPDQGVELQRLTSGRDCDRDRDRDLAGGQNAIHHPTFHPTDNDVQLGSHNIEVQTINTEDLNQTKGKPIPTSHVLLGCIRIFPDSHKQMTFWACLQYIALSSTTVWFGLTIFDFKEYCIVF